MQSVFCLIDLERERGQTLSRLKTIMERGRGERE